MLKNYLKQRAPSAEDLISKYKLGFLGNALFAPKVWRFHRQDVARAIAVGFFIGLTPLPGHMIMAACVALLWPANLPVAVLCVWITNPITLAPISYFEYLIGIELLGWPHEHFKMEWNWQWILKKFMDIWTPMMLGGLVLGTFVSTASYWIVFLSWRFNVGQKWKQRHLSRKN